MSAQPRTASTDSRTDTDRIRRIRRRLVGATLLLLAVLLVVPMLDSDPVIEKHDIDLDIPHSPSESGKPAPTPATPATGGQTAAGQAVSEPAPLTFKPTGEGLVPGQNPPMVTTQPGQTPPAQGVDPEERLRQLEAQKKQLEAQKKALEAAEAAEQKRLAQVQTDDKKKAEATKKAEDAKKAADAKKPTTPGPDPKKGEGESSPKGTADKDGKPAKPAVDQTARAVAILEGRQADQPSASKPVSQKPSATEGSGSGNYVIQIGAYREKTMLDSYQNKIRGLGLTPFTEVSTKNGVEQTRLRVGPFKTREAAEAGRKKLNGIGLDGQIVGK